jgi:hypothetical protein
LESQRRDFLCGGVDLLVVISVEFMIKNPLGLFDFFDIFLDASADESVLEPTIGSFHFALGLRGKGIGDFHVTILQNLFPLRSGLIGQKVMFSPEGVPSLNKSKNPVGVHIIGESIEG